jgi:hypothetical protein
MGISNPGGNGSGKRFGGTGASPTRPPRVPLSLNSAFAGTVMDTLANAGFVETTLLETLITVSVIALTG